MEWRLANPILRLRRNGSGVGDVGTSNNRHCGIVSRRSKRLKQIQFWALNSTLPEHAERRFGRERHRGESGSPIGDNRLDMPVGSNVRPAQISSTLELQVGETILCKVVA